MPTIDSQRPAALNGRNPRGAGRMRLLILGGTTEASALARRIAGRRDVEPVLSFAGRTRSLAAPPIPFRVGGFGGVAGLRGF